MPRAKKAGGVGKKVAAVARSFAQLAQKSKGRRVRGRGGYFTDAMSAISKPFTYKGKNGKDATEVGAAARGLGEAAGKAIGEGFGLPAPISNIISPLLGNAASWFTSLFGGGAYHIRKNSLMTAVMRQQNPGIQGRCNESGFCCNMPPSFSTINTGSDMVFCHRELVANVMSSINFTTTSYLINPGNPILFPMLTNFAALYEEYEFLGLIFMYKSTSASAVGTTSSAMGTITMATDYDVYDNAFLNKRAMDNAEYSVDEMPFNSCIHPVECDRSRNVLARQYVNPGVTAIASVPGDARMSVMGNFTIATEGQQLDNTKIGELWVSYHVRLSRPVLEGPSTVAFAEHVTGKVQDSGVNTVTFTNLGPPVIPTFANFGANCRVTLTFNQEVHWNQTFMIVCNFRCAAATGWTVPTTPTIVHFLTSSPLYGTNTLGTPDQVAVNASQASGTGLATYGVTNCSVSTYIVAVATKSGSQFPAVTIPVGHVPANDVALDIFIVHYNQNIGTSRARRGEVDIMREQIAALTRRLDSKEDAEVATISSPACSSSSTPFETVDVDAYSVFEREKKRWAEASSAASVPSQLVTTPSGLRKK